jgi:hypothetical protein
MRETKIPFTEVQLRLVTEVSRKHAEEMNAILNLIYGELGIKEEMLARRVGVTYRLLPDFTGVLKIEEEALDKKNG